MGIGKYVVISGLNPIVRKNSIEKDALLPNESQSLEHIAGAVLNTRIDQLFSTFTRNYRINRN